VIKEGQVSFWEEEDDEQLPRKQEKQVVNEMAHHYGLAQ
jgi:predicted Zn-dependent protease with MMP-like domain